MSPSVVVVDVSDDAGKPVSHGSGVVIGPGGAPRRYGPEKRRFWALAEKPLRLKTSLEHCVLRRSGVLQPLWVGEDPLEPERVSEKLHANTLWMGVAGPSPHDQRD